MGRYSERKGFKERRNLGVVASPCWLTPQLPLPNFLLSRAPVITRTWVAATAQHPHHCPGLWPLWHPLHGGSNLCLY